MAGKARTNITVDAELLNQARDLGVNVSAVLETRLRYLDRHGLWSDGLRQF